MVLNVSRGCARKSLDITRPIDIISSIIYVGLSSNQFTAKEALYPLLCLTSLGAAFSLVPLRLALFRLKI